MKKNLVILALAMFSFANAQKGSVLVMGNVGYNSEKTSNSGSNNKQNSFNFVPKVGYQFHENWTAGIESSYTKLNQDLSNDNVYSYKTFSVGGFMRYSKVLNQTFSAYADLGAGFQNKKETSINNVGEQYPDKGNGFYVGLTPALLLNVGRGFGVNFNIGSIAYNTLNFEGDRTVDRFSFTFGQSFAIGLSKNF
ncbi:outer membrane beta-barrel protein [Flavobacterium sp. UBA4854]|uniref:outer membrane beta-barrel protein n=1 Tax=Flavobacterium sp. UBA4854 TaxID=1946548 RepID=UPI002580E5ED|nr:outer membrane beta-barrel protein [Flavobacterium sp. UBA4854]